MYFSSDHAIAARNEVLANTHLASSIVIESLEKMLVLYASTGKAALALFDKHSRREGNEGGETLWQVLAEKHGAELLAGYLQITGQTREKFRKLVEAQMVSTNKRAISALEKAVEDIPPAMDVAVRAAASAPEVSAAAPISAAQEAAEVVSKNQAEKTVGTKTSSVGKKTTRSK